MKKYSILLLTPALLLGGCVTTRATRAEVDSCRAMEEKMGLDQRHDHGEMKRQGFNPMNLSHGRCQRILRDAK